MAKLTVDETLLERAAIRWGEVQRENKDDRFLVTDDEWKTWEGFNKSQTERLLSVVDNFSGYLEEKDREFLEGLLSRIEGAHRMTTHELWERRIDEEFDEARREVLRGSFDHS